jgi:type II secretion system protein G
MRTLLLDYATPRDEGSRHVPWWISVPLITLMLGLVLYAGGTFDSWTRAQPRTVVYPRRAVRNVRDVSAALDWFYRDTGRYPTEDEGLYALVVSPPAATGWRGPYLKRVPTDPWGFPYYYQYPVRADDGGVDYAVVSAGPDGKLGTADDIR